MKVSKDFFSVIFVQFFFPIDYKFLLKIIIGDSVIMRKSIFFMIQGRQRYPCEPHWPAPFKGVHEAGVDNGKDSVGGEFYPR